MKLILSLVFSFFILNQEFSYWKVNAIKNIENESYIVIKNDNNEFGLIVNDNDSIIVDSSFSKLEVNKTYRFLLLDESRTFRGEQPQFYGVVTSDTTVVRIWDVKKDGPYPKLFKALNVKGVYIKEK
ncbi:hypothetical protein ACLI1A_14840 [Flavobacterium sp. RHBU_3]|uniref:hypothetical protein n=1 Tax=Flavobacterium sp. RHBU_3 TaxID=3391184 RepID=UPI003984B6B2